MNNPSLQLEALVRRIVREVLAGGNATTNKSDDAPQRLNLNGTGVITIADLDGRLDGIDEILAGAKTIVTPAAKDILKSQGIEILRPAEESSSSKTNITKTVRIADADSNDRQTGFAKQLSLRSESDIEIVSTQHASVVLADVPQSVVWKLCQAGRVAAQIGSLEEFGRVRIAMQPSTWVLDMGRLNIASATNITLQIIRDEK